MNLTFRAPVALCVLLFVYASAVRVILEPNILAIPQHGYRQVPFTYAHMIGWRKTAVANNDDLVSVTFALKQPASGLKMLDAVFHEVTNPQSKLYGQYLDADSLTKFVAASDEHIAIVRNYLTAHGVTESHIKLHRNKDLLTAKVTVTQANSLFDVKMHVFENDNGHKVVRADRLYSLPEEVATAVDIVEVWAFINLAQLD